VTIDEAYVHEAARAVGLRLDPARVPAVLANLQRIAALAQPVLEAQLGPEDEPGPEWTP